ncbi:MAG TPA: hypothetical protein PKE04_18620 [Clostridia bacterium]|nr:hypothetical protein [Clostridia bacterium]
MAFFLSLHFLQQEDAHAVLELVRQLLGADPRSGHGLTLAVLEAQDGPPLAMGLDARCHPFLHVRAMVFKGFEYQFPFVHVRSSLSVHARL